MGERHVYEGDGIKMHGYRARPNRANGAAVLVIPAFFGLRDFEREQTDRLAAMGYDALALDYYGEGWVASDMDEAGAAMGRLNGDREALLRRTGAALREAAGWAGKVGAIGFCFGGKAVLDMARAGHLDAGASLHGIYDRPPFETKAMPPVLLCHGWTDPLADPEAFRGMCEELEAHSPDWHALALGGTGHAFTNPAQTGGDGMGYVERSAARAFAAVDAFLARTLTEG